MINELIKEAKKGNTDAFEKIILYYKNDLFKIAKTRLSNIEDIEDAVQETIISVFKSLHKLKNTSKFKSWIFTILINNCNHILKKRKTTSIFPYDFIEKEQYINSNTNYSLNFEDLMNILELDERTILTLYYSENYTSKEISKILKMNDSTVRNKIAKAKKKIESNLKEVENYE
ncbi:MAG TPA: sigma-70 family RNA polymerase sigma factor [Candidatus Scatovivens faecipullorum]|nr:sigma-70 family RNA polymerase sigma factor [Candidatus Scatovivens faecipullorum]